MASLPGMGERTCLLKLPVKVLGGTALMAATVVIQKEQNIRRESALYEHHTAKLYQKAHASTAKTRQVIAISGANGARFEITAERTQNKPLC